MKRSIAALFLVLAVFSCSKDDSNDGNNTANRDPVDNPTENPTPAPSPTPMPVPFEWSTVTFEDDSKLSPDFSCENRVRFTIRKSGSFTATELCSKIKQSGEITADERKQLDGLMDNVSSSQARTKLKCKSAEGEPLEYVRISMGTEAGEKFVLYKRDDEKICSSGNPSDVDQILQYLYQLKSLYVRNDVMN